MRIAITGANGHVGAALCPLLLEQGHSLRLLVHRRSDGIADLDAERVSGDLLDAGAVDRFVAEQKSAGLDRQVSRHVFYFANELQ